MHAGPSCIGSISGLPIFTKVPPSLATPVQDSTFQVTCQAEGYPRPEINWTRAAMPLHAGRTSINQGTFTINNLSPDDSGFYECVATNIMGTKKDKNQRGSASASLRFVLQAPHISNSLKGWFESWSLAQLALSIWAYETHCNDLPK